MILLNEAKDVENLPEGFYEKYLKPSNICSAYLLHLINDILDYTEISFQNDLRLVFEPTNIRETLTNVIELLSLQANLRKIKLLYEILPGVPEIIHTDARRLKQILFNLAGNALKFTFKGYVKFRLSFKADEHLIHFEVEDTGLGIKEKDKDKLFHMFGKLEDTKKVNKGGTGLGLVISHNLAKRLSHSNSRGIKV